MLCVYAVWRSNTAGCHLSRDESSVEMVAAGGGLVVCMSAGASVQSGHSVSFHLHHADTDTVTAAADTVTAADTVRRLVLSEQDGVGLSVTDNVNIDNDNVVFYSFHGRMLTST